MKLLRASIFHTPTATKLHSHSDGALAIEAGRIVACGDYADLAKAHPDAPVRDLRGGFLLPGFIDTHVHFPQLRIIGALGYSLLDWLEQIALPEEARLAGPYANALAHDFIAALASHGTTTALVFGSHFAAATASLFDAARQRGLRIFAGLVMSDRNLLPALHQTPEAAYTKAKALIARYPNYAVTPRFALSTSEAMLEVCAALLKEHPTARFTTHINENPREIEEVGRLFPAAEDYLAVYEHYSLINRHAVLAHNIHTTDAQLERLAAHRASIAHCPSSNAALGSGIFPMQRHLDANVHFALGTDVGGGTGFGMMKEALQSYLMQRVAAQPLTLSPAQMLYLATRAGAEALALENETGDFTPGRAADFVYLQPARDSVLEAVLKRTETSDQILAALFTLADTKTIREVTVNGNVVFNRTA